MSKRVTGCKRLKLIQNYLNGREDDDYEVFPTKTEGKYIIRPRKTPLNNHSEPEHIEEQESSLEQEPEAEAEPIVEPEPKSKPLPKARPKPQVPQPTNFQSYDPTVNIEILNQLKLLGEEIRQKREKKEQKRMIKEVVQKQMSKPRYQYTQPQYTQEPNTEIEETVEEVVEQLPQQQPMRRRNNIFSDMF